MQKLQQWRKREPIGYRHIICTWMLRYPQWRYRFTEKTKQMVSDATAYIPLAGSITRWHGDVDAIEHAFIF
jgi:hypothetical protein